MATIKLLFKKINKLLIENYTSYKNGVLRTIFRSAIKDQSIVVIINSEEAKKIFDFNLHSLKMNKILLVYNEALLDRLYLASFYFLSKLRIPNQNNYSEITIVYANAMNNYFVRNLRYKFKNANIILRYYDYYNKDRLNTFLNEIKGIELNEESYCRFNADNNKLRYMPNFVDREHIRSIAKTTFSKQVVFFGTVNNRRAEIILNMARVFAEHNIEFTFYCFRLSPAQKKIADEITANSNSIIYNKRISYNEYLDVSTSARCIIDLYRLHKDEGISYRISEAVFLGQKIITDRENIVNEPFYNPNNILLVKNDENRLIEFLNSPCKQYENTESLTLDYWLNTNNIVHHTHQ